MSLYALSGAIESGLIYALLAIAVFISFRIMNIPDLTVDGSFTTGAAVASMMTLAGYSYLGVILAFLAGAAAGTATALLHTKLKINAVLSGILTMTALYSVNLVIMNNQASVMINNSVFTVFTPLETLDGLFGGFGRIIVPFILATLVILGLFRFFKTKTGLAVRATGDNETMVRSSSINTDTMKMIAMTVSNAFASLCGALIALQQNYSDIKMGSGAIILGLASLILGEVIIRGHKSILRNLVAAAIGAVLYQIIIAFALAVKINSSFLKLISALIVIIALTVPLIREKFKTASSQRKSDQEMLAEETEEPEHA